MTNTLRDGQVWGLDYTIGFVLFLLTLLIATSILVRTVLTTDDFSAVHDANIALSEQLMGEGYPDDWRPDDVVRAGLLTNEKLSMRKAERLLQLVENDYNASKNYLNIHHDYAFTLEERNGSLVAISNACVIGQAAEIKDLYDANKTYAYYYQAQDALRANLTQQNATIAQGGELSAFLDKLTSHDLVVLEEPDLASVKQPYDGQKTDALEAYLAQGGTLVIIGNLNLVEAFSLNLTQTNLTLNATGTAASNELLNLTTKNITAIPIGIWAIKDNGQDRYESLATLPDGRDYAARFTYGDGDVYYLGGVNGTIATQPFDDYVADRLFTTRTYETADCSRVTLPDADHRVVLKRLVAYKGRVLALTVMLWDPR